MRFRVGDVATPHFLPIPIEDRGPLYYRALRLRKHGTMPIHPFIAADNAFRSLQLAKYLPSRRVIPATKRPENVSSYLVNTSVKQRLRFTRFSPITRLDRDSLIPEASGIYESRPTF